MKKETRNLLLIGALGVAVVYLLKQQQTASQEAQGANLETALATGAMLAGVRGPTSLFGLRGYGWPGYGRIWSGV